MSDLPQKPGLYYRSSLYPLRNVDLLSKSIYSTNSFVNKHSLTKLSRDYFFLNYGLLFNVGKLRTDPMLDFISENPEANIEHKLLLIESTEGYPFFKGIGADPFGRCHWDYSVLAVPKEYHKLLCSWFMGLGGIKSFNFAFNIDQKLSKSVWFWRSGMQSVLVPDWKELLKHGNGKAICVAVEVVVIATTEGTYVFEEEQYPIKIPPEVVVKPPKPEIIKQRDLYTLAMSGNIEPLLKNLTDEMLAAKNISISENNSTLESGETDADNTPK